MIIKVSLKDLTKECGTSVDAESQQLGIGMVCPLASGFCLKALDTEVMSLFASTNRPGGGK